MSPVPGPQVRFALHVLVLAAAFLAAGIPVIGALARALLRLAGFS